MCNGRDRRCRTFCKQNCSKCKWSTGSCGWNDCCGHFVCGDFDSYHDCAKCVRWDVECISKIANWRVDVYGDSDWDDHRIVTTLRVLDCYGERTTGSVGD